MNVTPDRLDLAEFVASLVGEVRSGVLASHELRDHDLEVVGATIRVGREPEDTASDDDLAGEEAESARGPGAVVTPPRPSPITARPELEGGGWEVELVLGQGQSLFLGADQPVESVALPMAVDVWRSRDLTQLKGIDVERSRRLAGEGVRTIGQLLELDETAIAGIVARQGSHRYLDYWVQAGLLRMPVPRLVASRADAFRLSALAGRSPASLRSLVGRDVLSASQASQLFDLFAAWGTALDRAAMASVTLGDVRAATRVEKH
ncbi:hypothetical protein [Egicoccus sp. AB-alg2]|uniref:hypothetical protein n=1 Tax=Egicoccus sp. AB-alg2 TaxID=3242693 RepID=UPI00359DE31C